LLNNYSKNCVRLTTSSPASPKQEAPKRGRSGAGAGDVSCTPYDPIAPLPRVAWCGEWRGLCVRRTTYLIARLSLEAPKRGRSRAGAPGMCRVRSTSPSPPSQEWHGVASGEACGVYVRVCGVWGACQTRLALHRAEQKETTDSLFPLFY
jgi:hypothetical protein